MLGVAVGRVGVETMKSKLRGVMLAGEPWPEMQDKREGPLGMLSIAVDKAALASRASNSSVFSSIVGDTVDGESSGEGGTMKTLESESTSMMRIGGGGGGRLGM